MAELEPPTSADSGSWCSLVSASSAIRQGWTARGPALANSRLTVDADTPTSAAIAAPVAPVPAKRITLDTSRGDSFGGRPWGGTSAAEPCLAALVRSRETCSGRRRNSVATS